MAYDNGIVFDRLEGTDNGQIYVNVLSPEGDPLEYTVPLWKANFRYKRHYSPAIAAMMGMWDGDLWGSACSMGFGLAQVAGALDIPIELDTTPGAVGWPTVDEIREYGESGDDGSVEVTATLLLSAHDHGLVTDKDIQFAARVLSRYMDILDKAGESY